MSLTGKTIMIIDDDLMIRTLVTRVLQAAGCEVIACESIRLAMNELKERLPSAIILDLEMPEYDGFFYLRSRHQNELLASIPVLVLSGVKNQDLIHRATELGAEQFLEKPFEARLVLQKLKYIFYSKEEHSFQFQLGDCIPLEAEVSASILSQAPGKLKIESPVKFAPEKSVQLSADSIPTELGKSFVFRVDEQLVELSDGLFRTQLSATGQDSELRKQFEDWQRSLMK